MTIVTPEEMGSVEWSRVTHGCVFLDIWGRLYIELGHKGFHVWFHNTNWYQLLFRQPQLYAALANRMIHAAQCAPSDDLLGGFHFVYKPARRILVPYNVALLSRAAIADRRDVLRSPEVGEVRKNGFAHLWGMFDLLATRLGARYALIASAPIPETRLRAFGCTTLRLQGWRKWLFRCLSFPYRHQQYHLKSYPENPA